MISIGTNIRSISDPLHKVDIDYLYNAIKNPKKEIEAKIRQLRTVRTLDSKQYSKLKVDLPYFVCGCFSPSFRKINNFSYTDCFVLDIDNISCHSLDFDLVRKKVQSDSRVLLCFTSPSEDGLKVMFHLKDKCYDPAIYSQFYKVFATSFAKQYDIADIVDKKTCDVSRACFVSIDPYIYYNKDADCVDITKFWSPMDPFNAKSIIASVEKEETHDILTLHNVSSIIQSSTDPDEETMDRIKAVLFEKQKKLQEIKKEIFVPQEVDLALDKIGIAAAEQGIDLYETISIQYGKKLRFQLGTKQAEINLFYGKRGFSIVSTPRRGTSDELNQICNTLIDVTLCENHM